MTPDSLLVAVVHAGKVWAECDWIPWGRDIEQQEQLTLESLGCLSIGAVSRPLTEGFPEAMGATLQHIFLISFSSLHASRYPYKWDIPTTSKRMPVAELCAIHGDPIERVGS